MIRDLLRSGFVRQGTQTAATRVILMGLMVVSSIVIARGLGPEQRGVFGLAVSLVAVAVQFGHLGLPAANTYFVARRRERLGAIVGNSALCAAAFAIAATPILLFVAPKLRSLDALHLPVLVGVAAMVVAQVILLLQQSVLIGLLRLWPVNLSDLVLRVVQLAGMFWLWHSGHASAVTFTWLVAGTTALAAIALGVIIAISERPLRPTISRPLLGEQFAYGVRSWVACFASMLAMRIPVFAVERFDGTVSTGHFVQSLSIVEAMLIVPVALTTVLMPRLASTTEPNERRRKSRLALAGMVGVTIVLAAIAAITAPLLIPLLFGEEFRPSIAMLWAMLPGAVLLGLTGVVQNHLAASGLPWSATLPPALAAVATLTACILLGARGPVALGVAFSIGTLVMFVVAILVARRHHAGELAGLAGGGDDRTGDRAGARTDDSTNDQRTRTLFP